VAVQPIRYSEAVATLAGQIPELGNLEANFCFVQRTGCLTLGAEVLEIGTGTGSLLHYLREAGHCVRGVDISEDLIHAAEKRYGRLPITLSDGRLLPFPDASFDLVLSFDVFEHIPDSDGHLREVRRILRSNGTYLLMTPNKWTNVVFETVRWRSFTRFRQDHCSLHSYRELHHRLARNGFGVRFHDIPVVNAFFRRKVREYTGPVGLWFLALFNPDRLPMPFRTNFFVEARRLEQTPRTALTFEDGVG
jgi:SAM-dependent methyltransferase